MRRDVYKRQVETQYPYITLDMQTYSADEIDSILLTKIASDDAPQIFSCRTASIPDYVDAGYVYDLSKEPWVSNVADSFVKSAYVKDILPYVPMDTNYSGIFYNRDVFETYSLDIPTTLDELYKVCNTLKENGIAPFVCGFGELWTLEEYFFPIWMTFCVGGYGGFEANRDWFTDLEAGNTTFSQDEAFAAAFEDLYALREYFSEEMCIRDSPYVKYLFILPSFIMFSFALLYPFLSGIKIAFTNWDGLKPYYEFNGLDNFARMFGDRRLGNALKNTLIYAGMGVVMNNVLTLGLAVLFNDCLLYTSRCV